MPGEGEITVVSDGPDPSKPAEGKPCLVVFYGEHIGRRHVLDAAEIVLGRIDSCDITLNQDSVSRQHAKILLGQGAPTILDLGSTNGTFVNDERVQELQLRDGDLVRVGQTLFKFLSGTNIEARYHEEIYRLTTIDGLTQAYNKTYFSDALERELSRSQRHGRPLSLAMIDIDHFKRINDAHGHLAGDQVLRDLALFLTRNLRRQDLLARYGGEEFAIILPELDGRYASRVCEKLRAGTEALSVQHNERELKITISVGVATASGANYPQDVQTLVASADAKLYEAKGRGRNCVCC